MKFLSAFTRSLYIIPGGYFVVQGIRSLFQSKTLKENWVTFKFKGATMRVDLSKSMGNSIYWRGAHDWAPIFTMKKFLNDGDVFIDIGANQGEYTLWAARLTNFSGRYYCYEPSNELFDQLTYNIVLNPKISQDKITIRKLGLSNKPATLKLYSVPGKNEGVKSVFPTKNHSVFLEEITLTTLDEEDKFLNFPKIDFIKIDVEGAELQVLLGGSECIKKFRPKLLIEINKDACRAAGYEHVEIFDYLIKKGYRIYLIKLRGKITPLKNKEVPAFCNILAIYSPHQ